MFALETASSRRGCVLQHDEAVLSVLQVWTSTTLIISRPGLTAPSSQQSSQHATRQTTMNNNQVSGLEKYTFKGKKLFFNFSLNEKVSYLYFYT